MVFWNMYNRFFLTLKISKNKKQNKKHFFALVSKPNTTKFNSNPQWDQYIQHGGTTPKPTKNKQTAKLTRPLSQQNWNKPQFTPSLLIQIYSFFSYTYILHPMYNIGGHRQKQPPRVVYGTLYCCHKKHS